MVAASGTLRRYAKLTISAVVGLADWALARCRPNGLPPTGVVLYYHAVGAQHRRAFARQLDLLCARSTPWALDAPPLNAPRWAGISFDDAYLSVWENAVPELVQRNLPFTVFVPTGCLGQRPSWIRVPNHPFARERVMSREELRQLTHVRGASVGSHTVTHPRLTGLPRAQLVRELRDSKAVLEDLTGRPVELLSFPHGDWNEAVVECALEAGYRRFFGIEPNRLNGGMLPTVLGRVAVEPTDSPLEFLLKMNGSYRWSGRSSRRTRDSQLPRHEPGAHHGLCS